MFYILTRENIKSIDYRNHKVQQEDKHMKCEKEM